MSDLAFFVYDSRSGSTILSQVLGRAFAHLYITPEIAFDELLLTTPLNSIEDRVIPSSAMVKILKSAGLRNLASDGMKPDMQFFAEPAKTGTVIRALLRWHLKDTQGVERAGEFPHEKTVLVKNGSHLKYVDRLCRVFGADTPFIFLHRDPRDVIASKCRTLRPYSPGEVMAWGGVLLAAIRWHLYSKRALHAKRQGRRICVVSYEEFVSDPDEVVASIGEFLSLDAGEPGQAQGYKIPLRERSIHEMAMQGNVVDARMNSWQNSLARYEVIALEYVCKSTMRELGYPRNYDASKMETVLSLLRATLVSAAKILKTQSARLLSQSIPDFSK